MLCYWLMRRNFMRVKIWEDIIVVYNENTYYLEECCLEVYVGKLNKIIDVKGTENRVDYDKVEHFVEFSNEGVVNGGIKVRRIQRQIENANDCKIIII